MVGLIPRDQLVDMGFEEVSPNLFKKHLPMDIILYQDYRGLVSSTYAYRHEKIVNHRGFKEYVAIKRIELYFKQQEKPNNIKDYL